MKSRLREEIYRVGAATLTENRELNPSVRRRRSTTPCWPVKPTAQARLGWAVRRSWVARPSVAHSWRHGAGPARSELTSSC